MLEIKNLSKTYTTKSKLSVKAIDNVSMNLSETGMVFILGKSGSGKSTLLNLLGGLDKADSGDIIISGKSSKDFSMSDFDSYRNTFVGFIFQEYNILDEFTVGANIALAMELQGRKATPEALGHILEQVDLIGYADRKPNTLSGGQKQRVAIARALIKDPQIIMADEPTGALDSRTGKQVLETLKKLSQSKLVIVVSHDREFAEQYADRIIELADGKVISDVSKHHVAAERKSPGVNVVSDSIIQVRQGYVLTESDLLMINEYITKNKSSDIIISLDGKSNTELRKAARLTEGGEREVFEGTTESDVPIKRCNPDDIKLIRSRLPFKNSLRIGASGLKHKKFRLFVTIMLSAIAFTMFGLAATMGMYDKTTATLSSIKDTGINYAAIRKQTTYNNRHGSYYQSGSIYRSDLDNLATALPDKALTPVFLTYIQLNNIADISKLSNGWTRSDFYNQAFTGITSINEAVIREHDFKLTGTLPAKEGEVVITKYVYEQFAYGGYTNGTVSEIKTMQDIIGKTIQFSLDNIDYTATVTGVLDTNFDSARYDKFKPDSKNDADAQENLTTEISDYILLDEISTILTRSYHDLLYLSEAQYSSYTNDLSNRILSSGSGYNSYFDNMWEGSSYYRQYTADLEGVTFFDSGKTTLNDNEIIISRTAAEILLRILDKYDQEPSVLNGTTDMFSYNSRFDETAQIYKELKIVGINDTGSTIYISSSLFEEISSIGATTEGYSYVLSEMPETDSGKLRLINYCYDSYDRPIKYSLVNSVSYILENVNDLIEAAAAVCMWIGLVLAIFAALLLSNFIATSISYKRKEIGILRAVGARGNDVFGIFFNESMIIALINWVVATVFTVTGVVVINNVLRSNYGLLITILNFGIPQIALMIAISVFVAFISSFLPVWLVSRKRPIDAIRSK